jgi:cytoskeletal protein CcmA (bactofilin family)
MKGELICGQLTNTGRFDGQAVVHGKIELSGTSLTTGEITGQSLTVQPGATITGHARIGSTVRSK